jgi:2-succinyl-6-hydroxy-2,4-cyclohexadiene-1-carboxylate synthase
MTVLQVDRVQVAGSWQAGAEDDNHDVRQPQTCHTAMRYNVLVAGEGPPLVLLHGFTGCAAGWAPQIAVFKRDFTCIAVDLPGHGGTDAPADPACYGMASTVADLVALLGQLGFARATWLGYSMGGRIALGVGVFAPDAVAALVLEGATPGIADPAERAARVASDEALAARIERDGIAPFVDYWERLPLFATQARLPEERRAALRRQRLANDPQGLANSLRGIGQGAQPPLFDRLGEVRAPTLLLAGAKDTKFRALAATMAARLPAAHVALIPGAGHAAHFEQPEAFNAEVVRFLGEV